MKKKKILIHSNFCKMFTGFGKHKKNLLKYLYKTGKYEIIELSNGFAWSDEKLKYTPWENYGTLPDDPQTQKEILTDEIRKNGAGYGCETIDKAIKEFKPDIYLGIEDVWAFRNFFDKYWWNKVNCIVHTTLDSLPILKDAVEAAPKIKNYFVWSSFAEKALHKLGHKHVKTVHGSLDTKNFFKIPEDLRLKLRKYFHTENNFIIGFVFRNQLRKSVPNLLDGFKLFIEKHPKSKAKLLLHTHWSEGWNIPDLIKEKGIDNNLVLTTYRCKNCFRYHVKPFTGQNIKCDFCEHPNSSETANIKNGIDEKQLNEIYNLMDVYCHPFTSGGQEIPIQEAKLTELITLVTSYSCGEDCCTEESGGLSLDWAEYREPGTQFIKASTSPESISNQLEKVYLMDEKKKRKIGKKARKYVVDNYSIETIGKYFENLFDSLPEVNEDLEEPKKNIDINFEPDHSLEDKEWVESLYVNILNRIDEHGVKNWIKRLKTDLKRPAVLTYFKKVALTEKQEEEIKLLKEEFAKSPNEKRIAFIQPRHEEEIIISTSILPSIKKQYPDHKIYFFTDAANFDLIDSHPCVEKVMHFSDKITDPLVFEGKTDQAKVFDIVFAPHLSINNNFSRNSNDKIQYEIYESD
jgi:glycosyltransferase involved in cell wall biosynthesis